MQRRFDPFSLPPRSRFSAFNIIFAIATIFILAMFVVVIGGVTFAALHPDRMAAMVGHFYGTMAREGMKAYNGQ